MNELDDHDDRAPRDDMIRPMDDRVVRAYLRGAVGPPSNVLHGWYHYGPTNRLHWVIYKQADGMTQTMNQSEVQEYVEGLWLDGVEARWRS